ncbi:endonuclease domain-containing protein [Chengkuizengella marina]|nr:DUF559 domain-containing protein [Chengkuizengella marina]
MPRDWNDYKKCFLKNKIDLYEATFKYYEENIPSPIERIAMIELVDEFQGEISLNKAKLETQKRIGKYTVDFYFQYINSFDEKLEIIIECDGHDFHEKTKEQAAHDKKRDRFLTEQGYFVLRFTGSEIVKEPRVITESIYSIIVKSDGI